MYQTHQLFHVSLTSIGPKARAGFIAAPVSSAAHVDVERDREADRETGDLRERPARVDGGGEDDEDEEERQHGLDHDACTGA